MTKRDYYEVLGLGKEASSDEVNKAFKKKALQFHPDRNHGDPDATRKFQEVQEAYECLKDSNKRQMYDQYGHSANEYADSGNAGRGFSGFGGQDFGDIFENFFGGENFGGRRSKKQKNDFAVHGSDLRYDISISLEDAFNGCKVPLKFSTYVGCEDCRSTGSKTGVEEYSNCSACHGSGYIRTNQGFLTIERACGTCGGAGKKIKNPCMRCHGNGRYKKQIEINTKIPAGVDTNSKVRISGKGEAGARKGQNGDLYVYVTIKEHEFFNRRENDLYCEVPIKMTTAVLGGDFEVFSIDGGAVKFKIPSGVQNGYQVKLRGKGMKKLNSEAFGELYVQLNIEMPITITSEQRILLERFDELSQQKTHPKFEGFLKKIKDFWSS